MDEVSAAQYLEGLRREGENYIEPSFDTICAYGPNGAIIHYSAEPGSCAQIRPEGLLMVDSGGHYLEGTTDITRTFVLGAVTREMKEHFTLGNAKSEIHQIPSRMPGCKSGYPCPGSLLGERAGLQTWHRTRRGVSFECP